MPVANPDGYDFTFEPGHRLWRKNLRDNNGDGVITAGDGVDLNRNYAYKWGYDNEGSSRRSRRSETYRGAGPARSPRPRRWTPSSRSVRLQSSSSTTTRPPQLLLYGVGWQVATPTPDDVLGDRDGRRRRAPGGPRLRPGHLGRALHHQRRHRRARARTLRHARPSRRRCRRARTRRTPTPTTPTSRRTAAAASSSPTTRTLIQAEFEKNIPFALSVAESAKDPADPVSAVGRTAADFQVDTFDVSYGDPQTVAVTAKRALQRLQRELPDQRRPGEVAPPRRSGRAASATATRVTTTTPSCAAQVNGRQGRRPGQGLVQRGQGWAGGRHR